MHSASCQCKKFKGVWLAKDKYDICEEVGIHDPVWINKLPSVFLPFPLQISPCLANLILLQFSLSSSNPLSQEMLGVGGTWGQINLENNCEVSISESYLCHRVWGAWRGSDSLSPQPGAARGQDTGVCALTQGAGLLFSPSSRTIAPGLPLVSWSRKGAAGPARYLSDNCGYLLHMPREIFTSPVETQTSCHSELLESCWRTQLKN